MNKTRRFALPILAALLVSAWLATGSRAMGPEDMNLCLCRHVIGRLLCKDIEEIEYIGRMADGTYGFSVFYASKPTRFYCYVSEQNIQVRGRAATPITRTIPYVFDKNSRCGIVALEVPECPNKNDIICCAVRKKEDVEEEKFWSRTIPALLDEDLKSVFGKDANATKPAK
ncbi:MAG: hypothetical protein PHV85_06315 [Desulfovibrionaceae bacterium]|nr:hypothetical protein [Desulfovibrionaceae bacterium]MDD4952145.1 hypothetical protein [Desulfovibrionaceae bacterium]